MSRSFVIVLICALLFLPAKPVPSAQAQSPEEFLCVDVQIQEPDCEALVALYNSTNGPAWINNTNWLVTLTPSDWYGVTVSETARHPIEPGTKRVDSDRSRLRCVICPT